MGGGCLAFSTPGSTQSLKKVKAKSKVTGHLELCVLLKEGTAAKHPSHERVLSLSCLLQAEMTKMSSFY